MAYTTPYVSSQFRERDPYKQDAGRMSDLIRMRSAAEARGIEDQANASAQMWSGIGNAVSGTLSQLAQYKADTPKREAAQLEMNEKQRVVREQANLRGLDQMAGAGKMDAEGRASLYEGEGFQKEAAGIRSEDRRGKIENLNLFKAQSESEIALRSQAAKSLGSLEKLPPEARPAEYARLLPQIREQVGEKYASQISDEYDADTVKRMIEFGTTLDDKARAAQIAAASAQTALALGQNSREAEKHWQSALTVQLSVADTPEEWDQGFALAKSLGMPEDAQTMFSRTFSPEAMQHARTLADKINPDKGQTPLSLKIDAFVRENNGKLPNQKQLSTIIYNLTNETTRNTGSGRRPALEVTPTQKRNALIEQSEGYRKAEEKRTNQEITEEELAVEKERVNDIFNQRMGVEDGETLASMAARQGRDIMNRRLPPPQPAAPNNGQPAPQQGAAPQGGQPPPPGMLSDAVNLPPPSARTMPPPPDQRAPQTSAAIPTSVTLGLRGQKPGIYRTSQGNFQVGRDGLITRVP